jgi:predicted MFS family arabinose efflux permease
MRLDPHAGVRYAVIMLFLAQALNYVDRTALSVLLPSIKDEFGFSDVRLGLLAGFAFTITYAAIGIPIARWADRRNRKTILGIAVLVWSAMITASGFAQGFWQLFASRLGTGAGEAGCVPPSHSMIVDLVPRERLTAVLALYTTGQPIGSLSGLVLGGWLGSLIGWRMTFWVFGAVGMVLGLCLLRTVVEPQRTSRAMKGITTRIGIGGALRTLLGRRSYSFMLIGLAFASVTQFGVMQWLPSYFVRTFGYSAKIVGIYFGVTYGCGTLLGVLIGGLVGDRLFARDARWPLWIAAASYMFALPAILAAVEAGSFQTSVVFLLVSCALLAVAVPLLHAMVQTVSPSQTRALAVALTLFASSLIGAGLGPLLVGYASDAALAHGAVNPLRTGLLVAIAFLPAPVVLYSFGSRYLQGDVEKGRAEDNRE